MPADRTEPAPINDTDEAKGLVPDPQLQEVHRREEAALDQGQSTDEAQARAWAEVNGGGKAAQDNPASQDANHQDGDPATISVGG